MAHDEQSIEQPERDRRHDEKVHCGNALSMVARNVFHPCEGGALHRAIYLATLVWPTSTPSLRGSPWMRGAPHNGLATLISRINRRIPTTQSVGRSGVAISSANTI